MEAEDAAPTGLLAGWDASATNRSLLRSCGLDPPVGGRPTGTGDSIVRQKRLWPFVRRGGCYRKRKPGGRRFSAVQEAPSGAERLILWRRQ
jgi:hypothetical protein